jgi:hypothetical protein
MVSRFPLRPPDLLARLAATWTADLAARAPGMASLLVDTIDLAEQELAHPLTETRETLERHRPRLAPPP